MGADLTQAKIRKRIALGAAGIILLIPVVVAVHGGLYDSFVDSPLSGWGMWGTYVIHMATRPSRREIGVTVLLGLAMRLAYDVAIGEKGYPGSLLIAMGTFLGLASLIVLAIQSIRLKTERRAMVQRSLGVIAMFNYTGVCLGFFFSFASVMLPRKLDYFLYAFDGSLGFQPSFALGKLVTASPALYWLMVMVYNCIGLLFSVVYAVHSRAHGNFQLNIIRLFVANFLIGSALYFLFPAAGPIYAFTTFPNLPMVVHAGAVLLSGRPNAMPSLHFGGTLLMFWAARPWKWLRMVTGSICFLTAIATMGGGEHYFVDLVVAVPYALTILAVASDVQERRWPLLAGATMVLAWLVILRYGTFQPALSWTLVVVTIVTSLGLEHKLARSLWRKAVVA